MLAVMFQSTHSLRSATTDNLQSLQIRRVSIHALLAECDYIGEKLRHHQHGFNPRTPCGVRLSGRSFRCSAPRFQSTHSLRSATMRGIECYLPFYVSIHALLAECDLRVGCGKSRFYLVSIHALLAECDCAQPYTLLLNKANHTLRQPP